LWDFSNFLSYGSLKLTQVTYDSIQPRPPADCGAAAKPLHRFFSSAVVFLQGGKFIVRNARPEPVAMRQAARVQRFGCGALGAQYVETSMRSADSPRSPVPAVSSLLTPGTTLRITVNEPMRLILPHPHMFWKVLEAGGTGPHRRRLGTRVFDCRTSPMPRMRHAVWVKGLPIFLAIPAK